MAEADLYPTLFINGTIGWDAEDFSKAFSTKSFLGLLIPGFRWNILNYGRILNNIRLQQARTQELIATYQNQVLTAGREVQVSLRGFLRSQEQAEALDAAWTRRPRPPRWGLAVPDRHDRFQPGLQPGNDPGPATGPAGDLPGRDRPEPDCRLSGPRGGWQYRLAEPAAAAPVTLLPSRSLPSWPLPPSRYASPKVSKRRSDRRPLRDPPAPSRPTPFRRFPPDRSIDSSSPRTLDAECPTRTKEERSTMVRKSEIGIALIVTLANPSVFAEAPRTQGPHGSTHFLHRLGPVGGWNPDGGGLFHWWNPDCFVNPCTPDDYCRKPLPRLHCRLARSGPPPARPPLDPRPPDLPRDSLIVSLPEGPPDLPHATMLLR